MLTCKFLTRRHYTRGKHKKAGIKKAREAFCLAIREILTGRPGYIILSEGRVLCLGNNTLVCRPRRPNSLLLRHRRAVLGTSTV